MLLPVERKSILLKKCGTGFLLVEYLLRRVDELRSIISVAFEARGNFSQQLFTLATVLGKLESIHIETNYNRTAPRSQRGPLDELMTVSTRSSCSYFLFLGFFLDIPPCKQSSSDSRTMFLCVSNSKMTNLARCLVRQ